VVVWAISVYNSLIVLVQRVDNAWSQIEVQLRRRHDLVTALVDTVKGYVIHERETLESVTEARTRAVGASSVEEQQQAEAELDEAVGRLVNVVVEAYPDLKASDNFTQLQNELSETEDKLAFARQFYNDVVQKFNVRIGLFPGNLVANALGYQPKPYFDAPEDTEEPVSIDF
jgi:LemA protein